VFDQSRIDALADLRLERDPRGLFLDRDAVDQLAVHVEGIADDRGALRQREHQIALEHAIVAVLERERRRRLRQQPGDDDLVPRVHDGQGLRRRVRRYLDLQRRRHTDLVARCRAGRR
jgi:hypothetical protein